MSEFGIATLSLRVELRIKINIFIEKKATILRVIFLRWLNIDPNQTEKKGKGKKKEEKNSSMNILTTFYDRSFRIKCNVKKKKKMV